MFNRNGSFQSRFSCRCGAHHVFNHNHKSYEKKMVEMLGGEGFDVIIEHLANINLGHDVQMLKNGARIMVVGCRGSVNINPRKYRLYLMRIAHYFFKRNMMTDRHAFCMSNCFYNNLSIKISTHKK